MSDLSDVNLGLKNPFKHTTDFECTAFKKYNRKYDTYIALKMRPNHIEKTKLQIVSKPKTN